MYNFNFDLPIQKLHSEGDRGEEEMDFGKDTCIKELKKETLAPKLNKQKDIPIKLSQDMKNSSTNLKKPDNEEEKEEMKEDKEPSDWQSDHQKKRWGRDDDKRLFGVIRSLEKQGLLSLQEILEMDANTQACSNKGVSALAKKFKWKSLKKYLVFRIQSLWGKEFSVRETKLLKRIIKKNYNYENLDYENILYNFPGKTLERVMEVSEEIVRSRHEKTLTNYCLKQQRSL